MWERWRAAGLALTLVGLGVPAAVASSGGQARVVPASGHPHSRFTVSFRSQPAPGTFAGLRRSDEVSVTGPKHSGCVSSLTLGAGTQAADAPVEVALSPGAGHRWCTGRYLGRVVQFDSVLCGPPPTMVCPQLVIAPETIARFSFRVR